MKDIIEFSRKLQELIDENSALKTRLMIVDEWLKLAISVNGVLPYRTVENADNDTFENFIENTDISFGEEMKLVWKNEVTARLNGQTIFGCKSVVKIEQIEEIFNSKKD